MSQVIKPINLGGVNCYLIENNGRYVLIDTGMTTNPVNLDKKLENAGCKPGSLELVILTHGDIDHAGNCIYIRNKFGAKIAMHYDDEGIVEHKDMSWNRKTKPDRISKMGRIIMLLSKVMLILFGPGKFVPFKPDLYISDGQSLSEYGIHAGILHLPGHSKGSIGVLTANSDLICGDLFMNMPRPNLHFMIDDLPAANASIKKLRSLGIKTVYPGHGKPFPMELLLKNIRWT